MFYRIPFEVEAGHQPLQNVASLADKRNRVQKLFNILNAYNSTLKQRSRNANVNNDVLSRPPLPATAEGLQPRYRLTDLSGLAVYFVGASGIPPRLRTSSDSSCSGLANASGGLVNPLGGLATTPDGVFFMRRGRSSVSAQIHGQQVWRTASKRFDKDVTSGVIKGRFQRLRGASMSQI